MDTKEQLIKKARKLFAKHGFDGVSTRSICEKAACNISAISYHFGSKEELYRACLSEDGTNILQLMENILLPVDNEADFKVKLRLFMIQFFDYSMNNRELILMISKDVNSKLAMESVSKIFQSIPEKLSAFFQDGIDKGIIKKEFDPAFLSDLVTQPFFMKTLFSESNKLQKDKNASDRMHFINQHLSVLFESISINNA